MKKFSDFVLTKMEKNMKKCEETILKKKVVVKILEKMIFKNHLTKNKHERPVIRTVSVQNTGKKQKKIVSI